MVHISCIFAESWSLVNSPTDSWNPELFVSLLQVDSKSVRLLCLLAPGLTRKVCQIILFHGDLVRKEQCTSVCTKITPVPLLTLYLVRIRAACVTVNLLLVLCGKRFLQVLREITQCRLADTRCDIRVALRGVIRDYLLR